LYFVEHPSRYPQGVKPRTKLHERMGGNDSLRFDIETSIPDNPGNDHCAHLLHFIYRSHADASTS
jgi:hypothetical protein